MRQYKLLKDYETAGQIIPAGSVSFEGNGWSLLFGEKGKSIEVRTEEAERYTDWFERLDNPTTVEVTEIENGYNIVLKNPDGASIETLKKLLLFKFGD